MAPRDSVTADAGQITLSTLPNPFTAQLRRRQLPAGRTVGELVAIELPNFSHSVIAAYIGCDYVPQDLWHCVRPKAGSEVTLRVVPGKSKNILGTVLSLALMAAAPGIGTALAGAVGFGGAFGIAGGQILGAAVSAVGRLAINAIAGPAKPRAVNNRAETPTQFITGAQNQAVPFGVVPRVLGKHRMVPCLGAFPFTETVGNDQYVRMLFIWGYGPVEVSDLRIGDTLLSEYQNVEFETRQGYDDDEPLTLIVDQQIQNNLNILLTQADGYAVQTTATNTDEISVDVTLPNGLVEFASSGAKRLRAVQTEVQYAPTGTSDWSAASDAYTAIAAANSPDMVKPAAGAGGVRRKQVWRVVMDQATGALKAIAGDVTVVGEAAAPLPIVPDGYLTIARVTRFSDDTTTIGAGAIEDERNLDLVGDEIETETDFAPGTSTSNRISVAAGGLKFFGFDLEQKQSSAVRATLRFRVARGQYDVRLRRITADTDSDKIFDKIYWTALRSIRNRQPINMSGVACTAVRIKATDQLNGTIDRFNGVVHSIMPDWDADTETWIERVTSNAASCYRSVLQGSANARPVADSRIALTDIAAWHEACTDEGREYNYIHDSQMSVQDVLGQIAACGRASPAMPDGKWSIVRDVLQTVPRQHVTPRNSWGFSAQRAYPETPHAFRVKFVNRDKGWLPDERVVYDDGYDAETAEIYEGLELPGVTSSDQAWKDARYHIATLRLRPVIYQFMMDFENIRVTRGDLIKFTSDVISEALGNGARIRSVVMDGDDVTGITLDDTVEMQAGEDYAVRIRLADGETLYKTVVTADGIQTELTFATPFEMPVDEEMAYSLESGCLVMFGLAGQESRDLIVKSIEPAGDLTATLTCLDAAPFVHTADTGVIPPYDSGVEIPPDLQQPPAPQAVNVQTGDEVLQINGDGSFSPTITVTLAGYQYPAALSLSVTIKASSETSFYAANYSYSGGVVRITDVEESERYDIRLVYTNPLGLSSQPLSLPATLVTGGTGLPADVEGLQVNVLGNVAYLSWDAVDDVDLSHYIIRFSSETSGATWESALDIGGPVSRPQTTASLEAMVGTYLVKAVDAGGRTSAVAASVVSSVNNLDNYNAVATLTEDPAWSGAKDNVVSDGIGIRIASNDSVDDWADVDAISNFDIGAGGLYATGTYDFSTGIDLGAVYTSRLTAVLAVAGIDLVDNFDTHDDIDSVADIDGAVSSSDYTVELQLRTTNDDPSGSPVWSGWMTFVVGDYSARAFEFRLVLNSLAENVTPYVTAATVTVDMPDRVAGQEGITSSDLGDSIAFSPAFKATPAIGVTPRNLATGDYYTITAQSATGFSVRFFNSAGTGVSRIYDWIAKGYGYIS